MKTIARHPIAKSKTVQSPLRKNLSFLALLLALLTYGCAGLPYKMYSGDDRPRTEIAIIEGSSAYLGIAFCGVSIIDVNQQGLKLREPPGYDKVAVLPGFHTVTVDFGCATYGPGSSSRSERVALNAEAGHEYKIKAHWWKFVPDLFIVDRNSGKEVFAETGDVIQFF